jgi:colanic acid biosynthesis glycosyl transferase WcaI
VRIGLFTQWYDPEPGPAALSAVTARALARNGHDVQVLTGFPNYPSGRIFDGYRQQLRLRERVGDVNLLRVPLLPSHDNSALRRVANYASFGISAAALGVTGIPLLDALWVNYSPVTLALPMWMQQLTHRTPTICEVSDLWPDTMDVSGLKGSADLKRLGGQLVANWCNSMYRSSDLVSYISPGVGDILADRGVPRHRLRYLPKSANERIFHPGGHSLRSTLGIDDDAIVVSYAGAMGAAQGLESLIGALSLVHDPRLVLLIAGSGTQEEFLKQRASQLGLVSIRFLGRLPEEQMTDLMATSDICYISLTDHPLSAVTMPSKTQAALASGRAILAAAPGDLAQLVELGNLGFVARPGNSSSIAAALYAALKAGRQGLAQMGSAARTRYLAEFSVDRTTSQLETHLVEISQRIRRRSSPLTPAGPSQ